MILDPNEAVESYCRNWNGAAPYAHATIVRTEGTTAAKAGAKAVVTSEGELIGWLGGGCFRRAVLTAARQAIATASPRLIRVRPKEQVTGERDSDGVELHVSGCPSKGSADVFIEPVMPKEPLVVIGSGYVARAIAELGRQLNFEIVQVDGDSPDAPEGEAGGSALTLSALPQHPGLERAFVVVATQGSGDYPAMSAALASRAPYVAFVASREKARAMRERLSEAGLDGTAIARLRAPAGLDIGARTPAEIAVAVLAEIIGMRYTAAAEEPA